MQEIKKINLSLEFDYYSLGDLVKIKYGKNQKKVQDDENGQYPIFGTGGLMGYSIEYLYDKPSVLIGRKGSIEKVRYIEEPFWTVDTLFYTEVNEKVVIPKFLYYVMSLIDLSRYNEGTSIPSLRTETLNRLDLPIPDLDYQNRVLSVLSKIDKKIEINGKINKNLELYLFYIFDETFMNLEFNEFSNSQDKIPLSWNLGTFNDIIESLGSGDWGKDELTGNYTSEVYCIRGADIPDVKQGNKGKMPIRYILSKNFQNKKLNENTIVLEISGGSPTQSTGRTVFITEDFLNRFDKDLICTNFCKVIKPALNYEIFIYLYFNYLYDKDVMFAYENGTTGIKNFDIKSFINNFLIVIPSQEDVINFNKLVKDVFDIIMHNGLEIEKLQQLRDTLLPKLMSGEIDVSKINCDLKIIIRKIYIKSSKLFLWRYLSENQNHIKNTKSNETLLKSRTIHKINKFLAKFNARYRYYRQQ